MEQDHQCYNCLTCKLFESYKDIGEGGFMIVCEQGVFQFPTLETRCWDYISDLNLDD